jgi:hypothetical protein
MLYFFTAGFVLLLAVLHLFRLFPLPTGKFSYFLISVCIIVLLLPVINSINFVGIGRVEPRKSVLRKK